MRKVKRGHFSLGERVFLTCDSPVTLDRDQCCLPGPVFITVPYIPQSLNYSFSQLVFIGQITSSYLGIISKFPQITSRGQYLIFQAECIYYLF